MEAAVQKVNLPTRLVNFFARYPPQLYSAKFTGARLPLTRKEAKEAAIAKAMQKTTITESITSTPQGETGTRIEVEASAEVTTTPTTASSSQLSSSSSPSSSSQPAIPTAAANDLPPNPFLPRKNPITGRWAGAKIGLRRQAELVKLAQKHGIEELLPPSRKSSAFKEARLLERGLRVKGTGEGQKVKGHKWERHVGANLDKRRAAMENMPEMIREWKQRGHGRGWKKYPK
ncbi:Large ribosomal subunit protein mL59 [Exophiala dermatitidis]